MKRRYELAITYVCNTCGQECDLLARSNHTDEEIEELIQKRAPLTNRHCPCPANPDLIIDWVYSSLDYI